MSKIEVNAIEPQCGTTLTVGASGDTITFPTGTTIVNNGTQTGFGRTGTVDWDTTAKTASFTAVSGNGYFVNTTSAAITLTLPASPSAGDIVAVKDYAFTFATNNLTVNGNGSPIGGVDGTINPFYDTNGTSKTFIYVDGTKGWLVVNESTDTSQESNPTFISATGGTITCCGDYKIHTFTGPGTFCVSSIGNPTGGPNSVDYLIVAGGGGMGYGYGGAGGAGGYRASGFGPSPLQATAIPVSVQGYPISIGGGGAGSPVNPGNPDYPCGSSPGSVTSGMGLTSTGGGGGASGKFGRVGKPGGSGGGSSGGAPNSTQAGGTGNAPPVSPPQGNPGESTGPEGRQGGGAGAAGSSPRCNVTGVPNAITGTALKYACGGRSGGISPRANSGFGGTSQGVAGQSGVVIIRYKFQ